MMAKISVRGGFSDRNKIKTENTIIQLKKFDERTRTQLYNMVMELYEKVYGKDLYYGRDYIQDFLKYVKGEIFSESVDVRHEYKDDPVLDAIKQTILKGSYDEVLTLIEALTVYWDAVLAQRHSYMYGTDLNMGRCPDVYKIANDCFKREYVGYRFINGYIEPISDDYEVESITEALSIEYDSVYEHISNANRLLSDRNKPDYANSIKESILAVEALCEIITGVKGKGSSLGNTLKKLEDSGIKIHQGLKTAFSSLYGYTSDAKGIRHAGDIDGPAATFEEAKFMLVACCAFINYLKDMQSKTERGSLIN